MTVNKVVAVQERAGLQLRLFGTGLGLLDWLAALAVAHLAWWLIGRELHLGAVAAACGALVLAWGICGGIGFVWFARFRGSRVRSPGFRKSSAHGDSRERREGRRPALEREASR